jgi:hypothetical protein
MVRQRHEMPGNDRTLKLIVAFSHIIALKKEAGQLTWNDKNDDVIWKYPTKILKYCARFCLFANSRTVFIFDKPL